MAVRDDFAPGEVLAAADLNDTFASKLDLAGGKILQIVRATDTTLRSSTSQSFVDVTGMSVTITPQKNDSAVIIIATGLFGADATVDVTRVRYQIADSSNNAISGASEAEYGLTDYSGSGTRTFRSGGVLIGYSTPATTSATTYKLRFRCTTANQVVYSGNSIMTGQMYAIEVSA